MFELTPFGYRRVASYNPFRELEEMSHSFWNDADVSGFRTDIKKVDGNYVLEAELPGFKKEDINIDIDKDCLTISAERKSEERKTRATTVLYAASVITDRSAAASILKVLILTVSPLSITTAS